MSIATLVKGFNADPYFQRAEAEVWLPFGGKPHWGKLHYLGHVRTSLPLDCWLGIVVIEHSRRA